MTTNHTPAKSRTMLAGALERMNYLISIGREYPDAQYHASVEFGVSAEDLQAEYDAERADFDCRR